MHRCEVVFPPIWNWWCPRCGQWVASADVDLQRRHVVPGCKAKVEWRSCEIVPAGDRSRKPSLSKQLQGGTIT